MEKQAGWRGTHRKVAELVVALALALVGPAEARAASQEWNDANIAWKSYDEGLALARLSHRPICLVFYATWCSHCANYSKVFSDPAVVSKARSFVMIRLDQDQHRELSKRYNPDREEYIPRTLFLSSEGKLDESITAERPTYRYFYHERDPASLLAGMERALKKLH
jgi:protein-disulfide reductase (glutathione)